MKKIMKYSHDVNIFSPQVGKHKISKDTFIRNTESSRNSSWALFANANSVFYAVAALVIAFLVVGEILILNLHCCMSFSDCMMDVDDRMQFA